MEQFSLEKYLANPSRKVVTRNGRNVRIICTDKKGYEYPIVALVENKFEEIEIAVCYTEGGKLYSNDSSNADLFFAPEKHEGWVNVYKNLITSTSFYCDYVFDSEEKAKECGDDAIATVKIEWEE